MPKDPSIKGPFYSTFTLGSTSIIKCMIPGARVGRLWEEAVALAIKHTFGEIIVNVGANYIPSLQSRHRYWYFPASLVVGEEIKSLLNALADLFNTDITFSAIPP